MMIRVLAVRRKRSLSRATQTEGGELCYRLGKIPQAIAQPDVHVTCQEWITQPEGQATKRGT
jgi:hypothetical protein